MKIFKYTATTLVLSALSFGAKAKVHSVAFTQAQNSQRAV